MEDARPVSTIYTNLTSAPCLETRATFARGVTCMDLMADGSCFKSVAMLPLTSQETGFLMKMVLVNLASGSGLEIASCML